jgi:hypothetical protein
MSGRAPRVVASMLGTPPAAPQSLPAVAAADSVAGGGAQGGGSSPDPSPAPGPGGASSGPSGSGNAGFGGSLALILLFALTMPALRRRMVLSPAGLGPAGFLSLLERPG